MSGIYAGDGEDCNRVKIGGRTELFGDPSIKPEKPYTIVCFPGGHVEIARASDEHYWVHVAVRAGGRDPEQKAGRIVRARMDHRGRYNDEGNAVLNAAIEAGDVEHIAFLVRPGEAP